MKAQKKVEVNIGWACNNNCRFCIENQHRKKGKNNEWIKFKPLELINKTLKEFAAQDTSHLILVGGEPTIHPKIIEILESAKKIGFKEIFVTTNGRMLSDKNFAKKICNAGATKFIFSIHGSCAKTHDYLTQSHGSFAQAMKGLANIRKLEKPAVSNTVINKYNFRELPEIAKLLSKFGLENMGFSFIIPRDFNMSSMPKYSEIKEYLKSAIKESGGKISFSSVPPCIIPKYANLIEDLRRPECALIKHLKESDEVVESFKRHSKKIDSCKLCRHNPKCYGIWSLYLEKYGKEEFNPVK